MPLLYWIAAIHMDTVDTCTLTLRPEDNAIRPFLPGQFAVLSLPEVGAVSGAISGDPAVDDGTLVVTITPAPQCIKRGTMAGVRGPFGHGWHMRSGTDLVMAAHGHGQAVLRPALLTALRHRRRLRRIVYIAGAKTPAELMFADELAATACNTDAEVLLTVDEPNPDWPDHVGSVADVLAALPLNPRHTTALLSGPETLVHQQIAVLIDRGMRLSQIDVASIHQGKDRSSPRCA